MKTYHGTGTFSLNIEFEDSQLGVVLSKICPEVTFDAEGTRTINPGCMYLPNGDPGFPPEDEEEKNVTAVYLNEAPIEKEAFIELWEMCEKQLEKEELDYE